MTRNERAKKIAWIAWSMLSHDSDPETDPWAIETFAILVKKIQNKVLTHV